MGILECKFSFQHKLVAQHPGHLNRLLHQAIAAGATTHRRLVPLGHGVGDAACQGAGWGLADQVVVKDEQIWAAGQGHIAQKGTFS